MLFHNHNSPSQRFHLLTRQSSDFGNSISVNTFFDHILLVYKFRVPVELRDLAGPEESLEDIGPELLSVWELYYLECIDFFFRQPGRCRNC